MGHWCWWDDILVEARHVDGVSRSAVPLIEARSFLLGQRESEYLLHRPGMRRKPYGHGWSSGLVALRRALAADLTWPFEGET